MAVAPIFVLTLLDYHQQREDLLADVEYDARLMLSGALVAEREAMRSVDAMLKTMAGADNLRTGDAKECALLAGRLMLAYRDLSNLGAATPDGEVFCTGLVGNSPINVMDRQWFQDTWHQNGTTNGQFLIGRISGKPGVTFGFPVKNPDGTLRFSLFAATNIEWFDRFTRITVLPPGWTSLLMSRDGLTISRYPAPEKWRGQSLSDESRKALQRTLENRQTRVRMLGVDGVDRLFVLAPLTMADGQLLVSIGVPVAQTLDPIEQAFQRRLLLVTGLAIFSLLLARILVKELVSSRFAETIEENFRLRQALDQVPAYVFIKDTALRYRYANKRVLDLFGVSGETLKGQSDADFFQADAVAQIQDNDRRALSGEVSDAVVAATEMRSGERRFYHEIKNPIYDPKTGHPLGLLGISLDVTAQQLVQETVRKLSRAIEQSSESIVITNLAAEIDYVNDTFEQVTGYTRDEVIGKNPKILQSGKTAPETYAAMWASLQAGCIWRGEFINRRKDGVEYLEAVTVSPIRNEDDQITHYVAVKTNITAQRQNELELARYRAGLEKLVCERTYELAVAKERAEMANRAKSTFLANMSHEIRTPMNAIMGLNYLLLQTPLSEVQRDKVTKVSKAAEHLLHILNDILDLSRIESGRMEILHEVFSPGELLSGVAFLLREKAQAKGLLVTVEDHGLPGAALGDVTRLRQVLLNFASNALKFTDHGQVTLIGGVDAEDSENGTLMCRFSVRDTGMGIPPDQLPRLFKAFEQLDGSMTRKVGGTGLGLAIAKELVTLMGGEVGVESTPGVGSTFWARLTLKRTPLPASPAVEQADPQLPSLAGHVLVVEDDPLNQEMVCELLREIGLTVETVANGRLAIERVKTGTFDLILMDLQMPECDGLDATRAILALPDRVAPPIVAFTADILADDQAQCLAAGMVDFIAKPIDVQRLHAVLASYLKVLDTEEVSRPASPVLPDVGRLRTALIELRQLLLTGNVEASLLFDRIREEVLALHLGAGHRLSEEMARYHYEKALSCVDLVLSAFEGEACRTEEE